MQDKTKEYLPERRAYSPPIEAEIAQFREAIDTIQCATRAIDEAHETIKSLLNSRGYHKGN